MVCLVANPPRSGGIKQEHITMNNSTEWPRSVLTGRPAYHNGCFHCNNGAEPCICPGLSVDHRDWVIYLEHEKTQNCVKPTVCYWDLEYENSNNEILSTTFFTINNDLDNDLIAAYDIAKWYYGKVITLSPAE
jgi:hypothetical protein